MNLCIVRIMGFNHILKRGVCMQLIVDYQWYLFITVEILSWVMLLGFGVSRYIFHQKKISNILLMLFILFILLEAILALVVYQATDEISDFQIIIIIFVL